MPTTLADLTLKLSRDISSLEETRAREIFEAERERDIALARVAAASAVLNKYQQTLEKAKQSQIRATEEADEARDREIDDAEEERRQALTREELKYRNARTEAVSRKDEASRKARAKWTQAVEKAREGPLSDQRRLRQAADAALERALEEARDGYHLAIEEARLAHQSAIQDRIVEERLAVESARRKAERQITGAAIDFERTVAVEETRLRDALAAFPEAKRAQEEHDRKVAAIHRRCEESKEALFQKFTRERRGSKR
jgi:hypothetical protein